MDELLEKLIKLAKAHVNTFDDADDAVVEMDDVLGLLRDAVAEALDSKFGEGTSDDLA